jgi:hypothetical protein
MLGDASAVLPVLPACIFTSALTGIEQTDNQYLELLVCWKQPGADWPPASHPMSVPPPISAPPLVVYHTPACSHAVPRLVLQDSSYIQKPAQTIFRLVGKDSYISNNEFYKYIFWINKSDQHEQCNFCFYIKYDICLHQHVQNIFFILHTPKIKYS